MYFTNKTIWITGASSGIGEALAYHFAEQNARLILSSRKKETLQKVQNKCLQKCSFCEIVIVDMEQESSIETALTSIKHITECVDVLVLNAGVSQRSLALETSIEVDKKIFQVNFLSNVYLTKKLFSNNLLNQKNGHIAVMSSIAGKFGYPLRSAYAASKHALHGFFETLRTELINSDIFVTMICPGRIQTDIANHALDGKGNIFTKGDAAIDHGIPVNICAKKILRAIEKRKREVFIGGKEINMIFFKRYFPPVFYKILSYLSNSEIKSYKRINL